MNVDRELILLGPSLEWPETPDVTTVVAARIAETAPRRRRAPRRRLALALAVLVAAVLAVLAVPPARTAIFDWFGIGGVEIVQVDELPPVSPRPGLDVLGAVTTLDAARAEASFRVADPPDDEPAPDEVRLAASRARVTYLWREGTDVRLLVTQFPGSAGDPGLLKKLVANNTPIEQFVLDGDPAVWIAGGPHVVYVLTRAGTVREDDGWLAGNTLIVVHDGVTVRVEGQLEREDAIELVRAMRR
jgi:hypothetical protein